MAGLGGDAVDGTAAEINNLTQSFADTGAFRSLQGNAEQFCFELSYPADNDEHLDFEPWHWRFIRREPLGQPWESPP